MIDEKEGLQNAHKNEKRGGDDSWIATYTIITFSRASGITHFYITVFIWPPTHHLYEFMNSMRSFAVTNQSGTTVHIIGMNVLEVMSLKEGWRVRTY